MVAVRFSLAIGLAFSILACSAATASARAVVSTGAGPSVTVQVTPVLACGGIIGANCADGDHQMAIRPGPGFVRVEQLAFGDPTITSSDGKCTADFLANRVTCGVFPTEVTLNMGDGADHVQVGPSERASGRPLECVRPLTPPGIVMTASLGPGDDKLSVPEDTTSTVCPAGEHAVGTFAPKLTVDGGSGKDDIRGGPLADNLSGGGERDVLIGYEGNDTLDGGAGDDEVEGGLGEDVITDTHGADILHGNGDNDRLTGGTGAKLFGDSGDDYFNEKGPSSNLPLQVSGGEGFDTVDFSGRQASLVLVVGNPSTRAGEGPEQGNNIVDAERVLGGDGGDLMTGSEGNDILIGNGGTDLMDGGLGSDTLQGGPGDDELVSPENEAREPVFGRVVYSDHLEGGADEDRILAKNGAPDVVSCGEGSDTAEVDLKDSLVVHFFKFGTATLELPDCEQIIKEPVDDSPPGRPRGRTIRLRRHTAIVVFRCPKVSLPGCTGQLLIQDPRRGGKVLGQVSYALKLGQTRTLRVHLGHRAVRLLRRVRRTIVRTVEQGHSKIGPRGSEFVLAVHAR